MTRTASFGSLFGSRKVLISGAALILVLYWIYGVRPLVAEPWQWADDGLYLRQAEGFVNWIGGGSSKWLGNYDPVLLSKAPLFGIFLGLTHVFQFPLRFVEFALLLLLPIIFRAAVRPLTDISGWRLLIVTFVLVALPFLPLEQRLIRNTLHAFLSSSCLIASVGLILRSRGPASTIAPWAASTGIFFSLSYLNREETIWLAPVVFAAFSAVFVVAFAKRSFRPALIAVLTLSVAFVPPIALVALLNFQAYGLAATTTRRAPAFTKVHQTLTSLEPKTRQHFVPIISETRHKAYLLSPTFSLLQSYLEGPETDSIATHSAHLYLNGYPEGEREFFVSNFEFVFRNAAFHVGAKDARSAEELFHKIDREIKSAVKENRIEAGSHGPSIMAAPLPGDIIQIARSSLASIGMLFSLRHMSLPVAGSSSGSPEDLQRLIRITSTAITPVKSENLPAIQRPGFEIARVLYDILKVVHISVCALGGLAVVFYLIPMLKRKGVVDPYWERGYSGLVLCGSVIAFSLAMAVVHVLGFPHLTWGAAYNSLGFVPLSVLGAFGVSLCFERWPMVANKKF